LVRGPWSFVKGMKSYRERARQQPSDQRKYSATSRE
jgi:hypothetical protein